MEDTHAKQAEIIADIMADAKEEAGRLKAQAEQAAADRKSQYERQIAEVMQGAQATAAEQAASLKKSLAATRAVELRRISLRARDLVFKKIIEHVEEKLSERIREKNYLDILLGWIVEAAIGLGEQRMKVNASPAELEIIDQSLLKKACDKVASLVHRKVEITKTDAAPLILQGIVLASDDGRTAFNNQVRTRVLRNQGAIRKLVYDRLLDSERGQV